MGNGNVNAYAYDPNGNMTVRREVSGTETFTYTQTWTVDNRLASVTKTDVTGTVLAVTTYAYDGDGARVRKDDPDGTTLYVGATEAVIGASGTAAIEYYNDTQAGTFSFLNYTKTVVSVTTGISYAWGAAAPLAGMGDAPLRLRSGQAWALRWNQWVSVTQAGLYTVTVIADDGVGVSIAGVSVIYSLSIRDTAPLTASVGVSMTPGNLYQLQVSYLNYTSTNGASFRLLWTRPDGVIEDIPASALRARGRRDYYSFDGAVVAMKEGVTSAPRMLSYLHGDHLGSTSLTTDASGQKVSEQRYKPYGEVRWSSGSAMPTDFTFTSQRAGPVNYVGSLMDYVARAYSPALGRFISADTIVPGAGNPQALNRYAYVLNTPLNRVDPSGHCGAPCAVLIAALVASLVGGAELAYIAGAPAVRNGSAPEPVTLDVTDWTLGRIGEALGSREMNDIRNNWAIGPHFLPAGVEALHDWVSMVRGGAQWDYKPELVRAFGRKSQPLPDPSGHKLVVFFGEETSYQAVANFTYGFYGAHIGLPLAILAAGAGAFQKKDDGRGGLVDIRGADCQGLEGCRVVHAAVTLGDDPYDSWWVRVGYEAYSRFGSDLSKVSRQDLQQWLDWYRSKQDPQPMEPIKW